MIAILKRNSCFLLFIVIFYSVILNLDFYFISVKFWYLIGCHQDRTPFRNDIKNQIFLFFKTSVARYDKTIDGE